MIDLMEEKSRALKLEESIKIKDSEVKKFQEQYHDQKYDNKQLTSELKRLKVMNAIDQMAMIRSSKTLLQYCSDPHVTHRMKTFFVQQMNQVLKSQYDEYFKIIFPELSSDDLPF